MRKDVNMNLDQVDYRLIQILRENSRLSFKEIGEKIHMTGQAVGVRVNKLMEEGIIEGFTLAVNKEKLGVTITAMIKVYMKKLEHQKILRLIETTEVVTEAYRTSADCCYFLKVETASNDELNRILDRISEFATYQLSLSIGRLK
jgi:Lrp/AsnC family leucine-responsive transcriptional regulator